MNYSDYTFFWGHKEDAVHPECSQFYKSSFVINGIEFNCTEQWMHWKKAMIFGDQAVAQKILLAKSPFDQKKLGREVSNFNATLWGAVSVDIVFRGNIEKFSQNPELLKRLSLSQGTLLVEASPYDTIWGIGLDASDPKALHQDQWQGQNLLGNIVTRVRDILCGVL
ncbi:NADAR family protein [Commensalibacter nepenthis]|uniref:NADAR family protein n=1 Tax=Commensalibacter nepenthis TaxID=3043872 RepID=A0ABT6Q901_9PROT|nr:NADAR family protein [Commensalibacter sp. TBRC 10068]MDI2113266.1 NADAR family protein [Commensalibacter sp. TBRC 10068]